MAGIFRAVLAVLVSSLTLEALNLLYLGGTMTTQLGFVLPVTIQMISAVIIYISMANVQHNYGERHRQSLKELSDEVTQTISTVMGEVVVGISAKIEAYDTNFGIKLEQQTVRINSQLEEQLANMSGKIEKQLSNIGELLGHFSMQDSNFNQQLLTIIGEGISKPIKQQTGLLTELRGTLEGFQPALDTKLSEMQQMTTEGLIKTTHSIQANLNLLVEIDSHRTHEIKNLSEKTEGRLTRMISEFTSEIQQLFREIELVTANEQQIIMALNNLENNQAISHSELQQLFVQTGQLLKEMGHANTEDLKVLRELEKLAIKERKAYGEV